MSRRPIASIVWRTVVVACALSAPACQKSSTVPPSTPEPAEPVESADLVDAAVDDEYDQEPERPRCTPGDDADECPTPDFGFIVS